MAEPPVISARDLRSLLIDCRIALRALQRDLEEDDLHRRLEVSIRELTQLALPPASSSTRTSAQQVALAWQTASRGLRLSHPELYESLSQRVMALLDTRELVEPVDELLQLEAEVKKLQGQAQPLQQRLDEFRKRAADVQAELDELRNALASAVPDVAQPAAPQELALARLHALQARGPSTDAVDEHGEPRPDPLDVPIPTQAVLQAVVAGQRSFTTEQRDWVVGEALGVTGWQFTPVELLDKGELWLAKCLLDAGAVAD